MNRTMKVVTTKNKKKKRTAKAQAKTTKRIAKVKIRVIQKAKKKKMKTKKEEISEKFYKDYKNVAKFFDYFDTIDQACAKNKRLLKLLNYDAFITILPEIEKFFTAYKDLIDHPSRWKENNSADLRLNSRKFSSDYEYFTSVDGLLNTLLNVCCFVHIDKVENGYNLFPYDLVDMNESDKNKFKKYSLDKIVKFYEDNIHSIDPKNPLEIGKNPDSYEDITIFSINGTDFEITKDSLIRMTKNKNDLKSLIVGEGTAEKEEIKSLNEEKKAEEKKIIKDESESSSEDEKKKDDISEENKNKNEIVESSKKEEENKSNEVKKEEIKESDKEKNTSNEVNQNKNEINIVESSKKEDEKTTSNSTSSIKISLEKKEEKNTNIEVNENEKNKNEIQSISFKEKAKEKKKDFDSKAYYDIIYKEYSEKWSDKSSALNTIDSYGFKSSIEELDVTFTLPDASIEIQLKKSPDSLKKQLINFLGNYASFMNIFISKTLGADCLLSYELCEKIYNIYSQISAVIMKILTKLNFLSLKNTEIAQRAKKLLEDFNSLYDKILDDFQKLNSRDSRDLYIYYLFSSSEEENNAGRNFLSSFWNNTKTTIRNLLKSETRDAIRLYKLNFKSLFDLKSFDLGTLEKYKYKEEEHLQLDKGGKQIISIYKNQKNGDKNKSGWMIKSSELYDSLNFFTINK